ncbi:MULTISPECIES: hypothetical protein [Pyrobaculum]|uniref:Uncharacterized protein n=1 Tax=Pyrobaculum arsenaticum (strain DSM 13514 / JCM 11321 / PZ6) TaxID=340102 RepID=A4WHK1_PYRAR|nr:hypothetical protein [Pyrobaculum arsenaticum]ABP49868.1 conserved hypothetical protein [Pyrobaculum arsenaticum DSM 13514]
MEATGPGPVTTHGFVRVGDVLRAAAIAQSRGGEVDFWTLYRLWGTYAVAVLEAAQLWGVLKWAREDDPKARVAYRLAPRGAALLRSAEIRCSVDAYALRGRIRLLTPFGALEVPLDPGHLLSAAYKLAEGCGASPRELYAEVKAVAERAAKAARGLEKWLLG